MVPRGGIEPPSHSVCIPSSLCPQAAPECAGWARLRFSRYPIERTTPPSTRSAAPVVADACAEQT